MVRPAPPVLVGLQHDEFHLELAKELIDQLALQGVHTLGLEADEWTPGIIEIIKRVRGESKTSPSAREQLNRVLATLNHEKPRSFFKLLGEYAESKGMHIRIIDSTAALNIISTHLWKHIRDLMNQGRQFETRTTSGLVKDIAGIKPAFYERPEIYFMMANVRNRKMTIRTRNPPQAIIVGGAHAFELSHRFGIAFRDVMWLIDKHFVWKPTKPEGMKKLSEISRMKIKEQEIIKKLRRMRFEAKRRKRSPPH